MSSKLVRLGILAGFVTLLAGAIALAQERKGAEPTGEGRVDVFNSVEVRGVVVTSRPDGARVAKGDIVCELDPTGLQDRLATQEIIARGAEADFQGARIAREVAVLAVVEYEQGTFIQEFATTEGEIKLAEARLSRAWAHLEWSRGMYDKGYISVAEKNTDELTVKQLVFALEQAKSKKKVLVDYSKAKTIKALMGAVETARARELAKQAGLERERSAHKRLIDQIRRCKVAAPAGGRIEHAAPIGAGAVVRDGQLLFRVVPDGTPSTKAKS